MAHQGHGGIRLADHDWSAPAAGAAPQQHAPDGGDNWVGGTDGNGDWNNPDDWTAGVPASTDTATFATGLSGYLVTGDATIAGILVNGDQLTFDGAITQEFLRRRAVPYWNERGRRSRSTRIRWSAAMGWISMPARSSTCRAS
ncbi:MAG: hypothetical protein WDN04_16175 [Rhodospirillales bacterium]